MVEENGRIPFTFARKKYLETESGIYPTHVCETKMSLENLNEFSDTRGSLYFSCPISLRMEGIQQAW